MSARNPRDGPAPPASVQDSDDAGGTAVPLMHGNAPGAQQFGHTGRRAVFLVAELGVPVEIPAPGLHGLRQAVLDAHARRSGMDARDRVAGGHAFSPPDSWGLPW